MGSRRLCIAVSVGRVTFLRVEVVVLRGEWEEGRVGVVEKLDLDVLLVLWRMGRVRCFVALVRSCEGAVVARRVDVGFVDIVDTLLRAREKDALILGLLCVCDCLGGLFPKRCWTGSIVSQSAEEACFWDFSAGVGAVK